MLKEVFIQEGFKPTHQPCAVKWQDCLLKPLCITGALANQHDQAAPRVTAWSTWSEQRRCGAVMLNEAAVRQQAVLITERQSAAYVHVDDTVFISDSKMGPLTR